MRHDGQTSLRQGKGRARRYDVLLLQQALRPAVREGARPVCQRGGCAARLAANSTGTGRCSGWGCSGGATVPLNVQSERPGLRDGGGPRRGEVSFRTRGESVFLLLWGVPGEISKQS